MGSNEKKPTTTQKTKTKKTSSALKEFKFSLTPRLLTDSHGARGLAPAWSKHQVMPKKLLDTGFSLTLDLPISFFYNRHLELNYYHRSLEVSLDPNGWQCV